MSKKTMFQILRDMNQHDIDHNTRLVEVGNNPVGIQIHKDYGYITMAVPKEAAENLILSNDDKIFLLLLVDKQEYLKRQNQQP